MEKLDKVIAGLEWCTDDDCGCSGCPYEDFKRVGICVDRLMEDTVEHFKALEGKYRTALEAAAIATELAAKARKYDGDLISRSALIEEFEWLKSQVSACSVAEIEEHIERIRNAPAVAAEPETDIYPLVIVCDRYMGTYSGGKYTAWNHYIDEVPQEIEGGDVECREFWWGEAAGRYKVGKGATVAAAVADLARKMEVADA